MHEFEELSTGFHEGFLNKYMESSASIMDIYISDSMQEILDIDIRSEVATVVGGSNEFSSLMNLDLPSLDLDINSNDDDLSWLGGNSHGFSTTNDIYADVGACVNPNSVMPAITSSILNSPKSHLNLNAAGSLLNHSNTQLPSPREKKSHLTFSPNTIKVPVVQEDKKHFGIIQQHKSINNIEQVKKDLSDELKREKTIRMPVSILATNNTNGNNTIKLAAGIGGLTFANNSVAFTKLKNNQIKTINGQTILQQQRRASSPHQQQQQQQANLTNFQQPQLSHQKIFSRNIVVNNKIISNNTNGHVLAISSPGHNNNFSSNNNNNNNNNSNNHVNNIVNNSNNNNNNSNNNTNSNSNNNTNSNNNNSNTNNNNNSNSNNNNNSKIKIKPTGQEFPKPAYSYSCLIAMALKNSRSGSLPVSEIYSFMCEHFPYFKTAPNGWKNSVRHNLSLNKCFEKIEKPATNGGQRKGCLWAMNPTKISKMDEEVQKWSRKDPMAIRKAMVYPEHLEALERGEMKHGHTGDSDGENEGQSDTENSDTEGENDIDENALRTPDSVGDEEEVEAEGDFDIEVSDMYDEIDIDDSKDGLQLALSRGDLLEFHQDSNQRRHITTTKRARYDVNYSIAPASVTNLIHQHHQQQHQQQHNPVHHQQHIQHHHQTVVVQQNRRKMTLVNRVLS